MTPVLFNLYTCLMMECWHAKVKSVAGVGVEYEQLFRRYTCNAMETKFLLTVVNPRCACEARVTVVVLCVYVCVCLSVSS